MEDPLLLSIWCNPVEDPLYWQVDEIKWRTPSHVNQVDRIQLRTPCHVNQVDEIQWRTPFYLHQVDEIQWRTPNMCVRLIVTTG